MNKKTILMISILFALVALYSFGGAFQSSGEHPYETISQEKAKEIMDSGKKYTLLDVRTQQEYDEKHIAGAYLIPDYEIESRAEKELPDKDALILVYCRSGSRSKKASQKLAELGYTNVKDFGGINTWRY